HCGRTETFILTYPWCNLTGCKTFYFRPDLINNFFCSFLMDIIKKRKKKANNNDIYILCFQFFNCIPYFLLLHRGTDTPIGCLKFFRDWKTVPSLHQGIILPRKALLNRE